MNGPSYSIIYEQRQRKPRSLWAPFLISVPPGSAGLLTWETAQICHKSDKYLQRRSLKVECFGCWGCSVAEQATMEATWLRRIRPVSPPSLPTFLPLFTVHYLIKPKKSNCLITHLTQWEPLLFFRSQSVGNITSIGITMEMTSQWACAGNTYSPVNTCDGHSSVILRQMCSYPIASSVCYHFIKTVRLQNKHNSNGG